MKFRTLFLAAAAGLLIFSGCCSKKSHEVEHVFYIGLDGWGAYSVEKSEMIHAKQMMAKGAYTLKKRTVLPSSSAGNWESMFTGVGPEVHGFFECCSQTPDLEPRLIHRNGLFPNIFQLLRDKEPDAETGVIHQWSGIKYLVDTLSLSYHAHVPQYELCEVACNYIKEKKPRLAAIIWDEPDGVGHGAGHDTPAYYEKIKELDAWVGEVLKAIDEAGILDKSVIILTSDHGGIDHGHGGRTMMEMETPLIITGKGIKKGYCFDDLSVMQYDVAAIMADLLGVEPHRAWFGRTIPEIFE